MNGDWSKTSRVNDEELIREELYSIERLEQCAPMLADEHQVSERPRRGRELLPRFEENGRYLITAYLKLTEAIFEGQCVSPAAEWLIGNFHVVEEQLREIRVDLPKSYYYELPKLVTGEIRGYSRIYSIAITFIAHTDSRLDEESLRRFIRAYQQVTPLTIGEMWAASITLRLALVETLRRLTVRVVAAREEREEADRLADDLLVAGTQAPWPGCIAPASNQFWAFNSPAPAYELTRAFQADGANLKSPISMADDAPRAITSKLKIRTAFVAGSPNWKLTERFSNRLKSFWLMMRNHTTFV
jgi:cyclic beta-1,2-glucan synthetase